MSRIFAAITIGLALAASVASPLAAAGRGGGGGGGGRGGGGGGGGGRSFSGGGGRSFSTSMSGGGGRSFSMNGGGNVNRGNWSGNWNRGENFARTNNNWTGNWNRNGNWNREGNWNRNWAGNWNRGRDFDDRNWWWWGIAPLVGSYWGNWYPGYWDNGYYGYPAYYGYDYSSQPQSYDSQPNYSAQPVQSTMTSAGEQYLNQAISAFQSGNYREAQRLAGHAIVDEPQNPQAHAIICLAAFATGNYQAAAAEAHAVASINGVPSWSQIYGVYQDLDKFTKQLRQLESDARQHPQDVHAQFLLGFLYMTMGYRAEAQEHLAQVVQQMPNDRLAANLLSEAGGQVPATASRSNEPQSFDRTTPNQPLNPVAPRNPPAGPPADSRGSSGGNQTVPPSGGPRPAPAGTPGGTET
jgi:tetratricopeptide (TPR) repeat protein